MYCKKKNCNKGDIYHYNITQTTKKNLKFNYLIDNYFSY